MKKLDRCFHEHGFEKLGSGNVIYTKNTVFLVTAPKTAVCYSNAVLNTVSNAVFTSNISGNGG